VAFPFLRAFWDDSSQALHSNLTIFALGDSLTAAGFGPSKMGEARSGRKSAGTGNDQSM